MICNLSTVDLIFLYHELQHTAHTEHISWLIFGPLKDVSKEAHLMLPDSVDERLGVCHLIDLCISHTIKAFDTNHDPVTECGKCIDLDVLIPCSLIE